MLAILQLNGANNIIDILQPTMSDRHTVSYRWTALEMVSYYEHTNVLYIQEVVTHFL